MGWYNFLVIFILQYTLLFVEMETDRTKLHATISCRIIQVCSVCFMRVFSSFGQTFDYLGLRKKIKWMNIEFFLVYDFCFDQDM